MARAVLHLHTEASTHAANCQPRDGCAARRRAGAEGAGRHANSAAATHTLAIVLRASLCVESTLGGACWSHGHTHDCLPDSGSVTNELPLQSSLRDLAESLRYFLAQLTAHQRPVEWSARVHRENRAGVLLSRLT
jgi:hypothetical protein